MHAVMLISGQIYTKLLIYKAQEPFTFFNFKSLEDLICFLV